MSDIDNQQSLEKIQNSLSKTLEIIKEERLSWKEIKLLCEVLEKLADNETRLSTNSIVLFYTSSINNIGYEVRKE